MAPLGVKGLKYKENGTCSQIITMCATEMILAETHSLQYRSMSLKRHNNFRKLVYATTKDNHKTTVSHCFLAIKYIFHLFECKTTGKDVDSLDKGSNHIGLTTKYQCRSFYLLISLILLDVL